jgi:hypothetical protein
MKKLDDWKEIYGMLDQIKGMRGKEQRYAIEEFIEVKDNYEKKYNEPWNPLKKPRRDE